MAEVIGVLLVATASFVMGAVIGEGDYKEKVVSKCSDSKTLEINKTVLECKVIGYKVDDKFFSVQDAQ